MTERARDNGTDFSTRDLYLSAYLLAVGYPLRHLNGPPGQRIFVFSGVSNEDVRGYYGGALIEARRLAGAIRDLKTPLVQEVR